jgi:hypothetical protein
MARTKVHGICWLAESFQPFADLAFGGEADDLVLQASEVKDEQGRHGADAELGSQILILLHIEARDLDGEDIVTGDGLQEWRHLTARGGPAGPSLDDDGVDGVDDFQVEVGLVQFNDLMVHWDFLIGAGTVTRGLGERRPTG